MLIQPVNNSEEENSNLWLEPIDEETAIHIPLTEEQEEICRASYSEIILHYIVTPRVFFSHVYESIATMSWKFYS
jgi:hypothetical protein|tara:strand:+ start:464 stop:688 length:225 start_codon:yes stop_codon:yes gene_type:complete